MLHVLWALALESQWGLRLCLVSSGNRWASRFLSLGQIRLPSSFREKLEYSKQIIWHGPHRFDYFLFFTRANGTLIFVNKPKRTEVSLSSLLSLMSDRLPILVTVSGKCLLGWLRTAWPLV